MHYHNRHITCLKNHLHKIHCHNRQKTTNHGTIYVAHSHTPPNRVAFSKCCLNKRTIYYISCNLVCSQIVKLQLLSCHCWEPAVVRLCKRTKARHRICFSTSIEVTHSETGSGRQELLCPSDFHPWLPHCPHREVCTLLWLEVSDNHIDINFNSFEVKKNEKGVLMDCSLMEW